MARRVTVTAGRKGRCQGVGAMGWFYENAAGRPTRARPAVVLYFLPGSWSRVNLISRSIVSGSPLLWLTSWPVLSFRFHPVMASNWATGFSSNRPRVTLYSAGPPTWNFTSLLVIASGTRFDTSLITFSPFFR